MEEKEKLILDLTSMDVKSFKRSQRKEACIISKPTSEDAARLKRDELASLQAKVGNLCSKTLDQENEIKVLGLQLHNANKEKAHVAKELEAVRKQEETKSKLLQEKQSFFLAAENEARNLKTRINQLTEDLQAAQKQIENLNKRIERLAIEKEKESSALKTCEESVQNFAEWMYTLVYAKRKVAFTDYAKYSCEDIEDLKSKLSIIVGQSRENAMQMDELKDLLTVRDKQVVELRKTTNRLTEEIHQLKEVDQETENAVVPSIVVTAPGDLELVNCAARRCAGRKHFDLPVPYLLFLTSLSLTAGGLACSFSLFEAGVAVGKSVWLLTPIGGLVSRCSSRTHQ
ncbi:unnamed protein product [Dibothriocephalus latus]|uniref:Uncharacterized protein n=1 Tax=Dibothriocephalus latus TaxID=60516 RepID=A0A3P7LG37_DIBLA|nr:unnamed protein product [Dibothriocephalus latus]